MIVIIVNIAFGIVSGLQPLLSAGSTFSIMQTVLIFSLQFIMFLVVCNFTPDADRIISGFACTQFFFEASATGFLLVDHSDQCKRRIY